MKKKNNILIIIVVVIVALSFLKDQIIRLAMINVGSKIVGAPIEVGSFGLGILTQKVEIKDFKLYNPPGFPNEPMVDFPELRLDVDIFALLSGKIHVKLIDVNMKEMVIVRNKEGKLNVDSLKIVEESKKKAEEDKAQQKKEHKPATMPESKQLPFVIDIMKLNMERVVVKDYTKGDQPHIMAYDLGLTDKKFENITSVGQMTTVILVQGLGPTAMKSAGLYAAATILGVGFLPAGIVGVMVSKDDSTATFGQSLDKLYDVSLSLLKEKGEIKSEDKTNKIIKGKYQGCDLTVKIEKGDGGKNKVNAAARQMMLPKADVASGFIYLLQQRL